MQLGRNRIISTSDADLALFPAIQARLSRRITEAEDKFCIGHERSRAEIQPENGTFCRQSCHITFRWEYAGMLIAAIA